MRLLLALFVLAAAALPVAAQTPASAPRDLRRDCWATPDQAGAPVVEACRALIDAGRLRGGDLAAAHRFRGEALVFAGRAAEALPDLERAAELRPEVAEAWVALAQAHHALDDPDRTLQSLDRAEALTPGWWWSTYAMSLIRFDRGDVDGAIRNMRTSVANGGEAAAQNSLCWYLATTNRSLDEAARACDRALRDDPYNAAYLDSRALVKLRRGDFAGAEADYISAYAADREQTLSLYGRGLARIRLGDRERGAADVAAAAGKDPTLPGQFAAWGLVP